MPCPDIRHASDPQHDPRAAPRRAAGPAHGCPAGADGRHRRRHRGGSPRLSANDFAAAKAALDNATRLLGERSNATLSRFLPAPPEGWTAGEVETDASAAERFGGGLIAKRRYTHGTRDATVLVIAHSPLIRQLAPLFAHSQLLSTVGRVFRVNGKTAVRTRDGKIQMLLGRTLVMIEGSANEQEKRALLELIDFAAIEKFNS